jgi:hypothetical protein
LEKSYNEKDLFSPWPYNIKEKLTRLTKDYCLEREREREREDSHVGIKLANKAGEVVVLEVVWEEIPSKLRRSPHDKSGFIFTPRHNVVGPMVIHQLVCLYQKWRRHWLLRLH